MLLPPADVPAAVLFRRLCELPRPSVPIEHRVAGAEHVPLRVQAVTSAEWSEDGSAIVVAALRAGGGAAFPGVDALKRALSSGELRRLYEAVTTALSLCSPVDGQSNWRAWDSRLLEGARHVTNHRTAYALGSQIDLTGRFLTDRPERFFGVAPVALVDAHWFAFRAARSYFFECQKT